MNLSPLGVLIWWADVRDQALSIGLYVNQIEGQQNAIDQASRELVAAGHIDAATVEAASRELTIKSTTAAFPFGGPASAIYAEALPKLYDGHYANVFLTYAQAIEQALARARDDQARVLSPEPRRDYDQLARRVVQAGPVARHAKPATSGGGKLLGLIALFGVVGFLAFAGGGVGGKS